MNTSGKMKSQAEEYRAAAENVVSQLHEDLGVVLNYDAASIEWLDGYINRIRTQLKKDAYPGLDGCTWSVSGRNHY